MEKQAAPPIGLYPYFWKDKDVLKHFFIHQ